MLNVDFVIVNATVATMDSAISAAYGLIEQGAVMVREGKIVWLGEQQAMPEFDALNTPLHDAKGRLLTPGLIDCHTHILFAGNRAGEFEQRLNGVSYQQIAQQGGGIASTVRATRQADLETLFVKGKTRLNSLLREGVTTVESKSGYGLDSENEIKLLEVNKQLNAHHPIDIQSTFLGAHALPPEYKDRADDYITLVCEEMLPKVAEQELAVAVDAFCENVGFSFEQTKRVFEKAQQLGLKIKCHAEQLSNQHGSELVAEFAGLSADHIEYLDEQGIQAMAKAGTTAVVLPGAFYFLRETQLPPIELLRKHKVPMAIASDFNPGTAPLCSLRLMLNMACTLFKMTPLEALQGVTVNAAKALGLQDRGVLKVGMRADMALWDVTHPAELSYQFGISDLSNLWISGKLIQY